MPKVLVAASEPSRLESLEAALARDGFTLLVAAPDRVVASARDEQPAIVLLGLDPRASSSFDACRALRADPETERVMIVVASPREGDMEQALDAGADYFVVSPCRERALLACFRAVLRRTREAPLHRVIRLGGLEIDPNKRRASVDGEPVALTPTEYELLHFLARHPGRAREARPRRRRRAPRGDRGAGEPPPRQAWPRRSAHRDGPRLGLPLHD